MKTVKRTPLAAQDYREIMDYLLERSKPATERFNREVEAACRLLAGQPRMGRPRDDLLTGMRSIVLGRYLMFFRAKESEIQILRILHGSRNITPEHFTGV